MEIGNLDIFYVFTNHWIHVFKGHESHCKRIKIFEIVWIFPSDSRIKFLGFTILNFEFVWEWRYIDKKKFPNA